MTEFDLVELARDVFGALFERYDFECIDQAGHRFLKVTVDGTRTATLWIRPDADQSFEVRALGSEMLALKRLDETKARLVEVEDELRVTRKALESESAEVLRLQREIAERTE